MVSRKVNNFLIGLAACKYLILVGLIIWWIVSHVQIVYLPVGEERYFPRTIVSDEDIERTRPTLYVNTFSTGEVLESDFSFLHLMPTDTVVKAKEQGIKVINIYHNESEKRWVRSIYYIFIVYEP